MKKALSGCIETNKIVGQDTFLCTIALPSFDERIDPGQFVQISTPGANPTFLKRPISVYGYGNGSLRLLYKVVGQGTRNLSQLLPGQMVDLLLPLGNRFSPPPNGSRVLLFGGGMGIAPLVYYINHYHQLYPKVNFTLLYGTAKEEEQIELNLPDPFPGSFAYHADQKKGIDQGNILTFYQKFPPQRYDLILACGPTPMMKALSSHFETSGCPLEVSLESSMACGYGVCRGCSFASREGTKTVCDDGPVFPANLIDWTKVWTH